MDITGSVALVTGANRGIGRRFAEALLERGAAKVYATARDANSIDLDGVERLALDIADPDAVATAAAAAPDVTLLINNAGISTGAKLVTGDLATIRLEMETHYFGTLGMVRAFAPILAANGGGALLNVHSALSWMAYEGAGAYGAAKGAEWGLTNNIRLELAAQRTLVTGLHMGAVDTDMMRGWDVPKLTADEVAGAALDGIEEGLLEVLVGDDTRYAKSLLSRDLIEAYPQVAAVAG